VSPAAGFASPVEVSSDDRARRDLIPADRPALSSARVLLDPASPGPAVGQCRLTLSNPC